MTKSELEALVAGRLAAVNNEIDGKEALIAQIKERIQPIVSMWDALPTLSKTTVSRLLPNLASAIDALRNG